MTLNPCRIEVLDSSGVRLNVTDLNVNEVSYVAENLNPDSRYCFNIYFVHDEAIHGTDVSARSLLFDCWYNL